MSATTSNPTGPDPTLIQYLGEEVDAAFLYRKLAERETDPKRKDLFSRLADVEDRHVEQWERVIVEAGGSIPPRRPSRRTRLMGWLAKRFGSSLVLPLILREEGREVAAYLRMARESTHGATSETATTLAIESAEHARELAHLIGRESEPWHVSEAGGYVRSIVYGFNDGLTANFGLVAGVIGASVSSRIVILTGIAGALADALSMGSSGYLAAKSAAEVEAHEVDLERREIELMPEIEREELALIYEARGVEPEQARAMAAALMRDPAQALATKAREELNITGGGVAPMADGLITGLATAIGAVIPIVPFFLVNEPYAIWVSLTASMLAHFGVGAARSFVTGRGIWASGRDMFLVGFGVAAAGYLIGKLLEGRI